MSWLNVQTALHLSVSLFLDFIHALCMWLPLISTIYRISVQTAQRKGCTKMSVDYQSKMNPFIVSLLLPELINKTSLVSVSRDRLSSLPQSRHSELPMQKSLNSSLMRRFERIRTASVFIILRLKAFSALTR